MSCPGTFQRPAVRAADSRRKGTGDQRAETRSRCRGEAERLREFPYPLGPSSSADQSPVKHLRRSLSAKRGALPVKPSPDPDLVVGPRKVPGHQGEEVKPRGDHVRRLSQLPTSNGGRWSGRCPANGTTDRGPRIARAPATRYVARENRRGLREGRVAIRQSRPDPSRPAVGQSGRSPPRPNGPPGHPSPRCRGGRPRRNRAHRFRPAQSRGRQGSDFRVVVRTRCGLDMDFIHIRIVSDPSPARGRLVSP